MQTQDPLWHVKEWTDMKKTLIALVVLVVVGAGLYRVYWGAVKDDWMQHHPITEIVVNGEDRKYHLPDERAFRRNRLVRRHDAGFAEVL